MTFDQLIEDRGCNNTVWLRILRECPEIIRPGMTFWNRINGAAQ